MKEILQFLSLMVLITCCRPSEKTEIITVSGPVPTGEMGFTLIHEHVLVDFIGADSTGYHRWDRREAARIILPRLRAAYESGVRTIIECTPAYLGRDPVLLQMLSDSTGIRILTNTGLYGAVDNKYLPDYAFTETADQLAERWIDEFRNGIEETGIRPGFIKISVGPDSLSTLHVKIVQAAARTHKATGMVIASHTGPSLPAFQQLDVLASENVAPDAFIWVHAQNEKDHTKHTEFAERGGWVSLDGLAWGDLNDYLAMVKNMKASDHLDRLLLSHDAGWYSPGEPNGGEFRGYTRLSEVFIPKLKENGFTQEEIDQIVLVNPQKAFGL
jgi:phosphotriesterase-related protein